MQNFKKKDTPSLNFGGGKADAQRNGYSFVYTYVNDNGIKINGLADFIIDNGHLYFLNFKAPVEQYDSYLRDMVFAFESFLTGVDEVLTIEKILADARLGFITQQACAEQIVLDHMAGRRHSLDTKSKCHL